MKSFDLFHLNYRATYFIKMDNIPVQYRLGNAKSPRDRLKREAKVSNPYHGRPDYTFWSRSVAGNLGAGVDPIVNAPFIVNREDAVATAGSCFSQHTSRRLTSQGFRFFVTETYAPNPGVADENYGVFSARFGNIYTTRQLVQLFDRAYGAFQPADDHWTGPEGIIIDPFRPRIQTGGFGSIANLRADRERHFAAVRRMSEQCDVFVFTLGLTEAWLSAEDGAVFPLAPGAASPDASDADYRFHNFTTSEVVGDLVAFLDRLASVNRDARVILTVSPVSLIATYEDRHVLVSTIGSKSILRAAVEEVVRQRPQAAYFPAYEVVTGPQTGGRFYGPDLREVTPEGVDYVMALFSRHFLAAEAGPPSIRPGELDPEDEARMAALADIVCDEQAILP